jgi:hypothetical protein
MTLPPERGRRGVVAVFSIKESEMMSPECLRELRAAWLPHMTDTGLDRLIDLLDKGSPLLISGCFTKAIPMGCLASHIAWNHPQTACQTVDAGISWLHRVAGLNPATSAVLREWDLRGPRDLDLRAGLLDELRAEKNRRDRQVERRPARKLVTT